ncbi:dynein axonemal assembly factor 4 [Parambassis ranga]|uniref:Dynein axonemal assembly factor 4 n=1 Tax=Parambassis ranga TaxID=210632 RepID=A0A6P7KIB9_9TELE|nr:dynein assembly factor 4, axonemal [Parambassis ranga]
MPLLVSDYSWTQTESTVYINVPLKGAKAASVDILSTDEYIKVHFPPYLFEAFLFEPVDDDKGSARVGNGVAIISLTKRSNGVWEHLMIQTNDKERKKKIRQAALVKHQKKLSSESEQKAERQRAERKYALETMMKLEKEEKESIQRMKDVERQKTSTELAEWQLRQRQETREELRDDPKPQRTGTTPSDGGRPKAGQRCDRKTEKKPAELPPPRLRGDIQVSFTPRVFPTALRESRVPEEEEWLRKQAAARRAMSADAEELRDLKEDERNPDWLKDRADKCFMAGDYHGAINAYSLAIRLNRRIPALYSNRAACHLKLHNLHKAIEDASQALELLTPAVTANAAARVRASIRRGSAFCQLQLYAEGLQDYQAALKINPHNEALQADAQRIRDIIQGSAASRDTQ